eukprot:6010780-Pyramimonas_sp.AAC.1
MSRDCAVRVIGAFADVAKPPGDAAIERTLSRYRAQDDVSGPGASAPAAYHIDAVPEVLKLMRVHVGPEEWSSVHRQLRRKATADL